MGGTHLRREFKHADGQRITPETCIAADAAMLSSTSQDLVQVASRPAQAIAEQEAEEAWLPQEAEESMKKKKMTGDAEKTQGDDPIERMDDDNVQGPTGGSEEAGGSGVELMT